MGKSTSDRVPGLPLSQSASVEGNKGDLFVDGRLHVIADAAVCVNPSGHVTAAVGVFIGPDDPRNVGLLLNDSDPYAWNADGWSPATVERCAALAAVEVALRAIPANAPATVHTHSRFAAKGASQFLDTWARSGWCVSGGGPIAFARLWKKIYTLVKDRTAPSPLKWVWEEQPRHLPEALMLARSAIVPS